MGFKVTYNELKSTAHSFLITLILNELLDLSESQFAHL